MKDLLRLLAHLLTTLAKLLGPGGARAIVADSLLMKQQLLIINRSRQRAPNLTAIDRVLLGFWSLFLSPTQTEAAAAMGVKQPTLNDAIKGRYHKFTIDRLVRMLSNVGKRVNITVTDKAA